MDSRAVSRWMLRVCASLAVAVTASVAGAQATSRITGTVTDSLTQRPLSGVDVVIVSAAGSAPIGARTDEAGHYTITGLAAGSHQLRARILGHAPQMRTVTVAAGETATANFVLAQQTAVLDQIVVTGTGGAVQRRSVGNVVETINADQVREQAAPRSVEQMIGSRQPGVVVLPGTGQIGTGAELRVRSVGSLSLATNPIVYIDGVRMDASVADGPSQRGGAGASRLNDISPEDIESIEIIKGPAASTLYGTEASNGVVQIITKRGKTGKPKWDFSARQGTNWMENPDGRAGQLYRKDPDPAVDTLDHFNLYEHEATLGHGPIFDNGHNQGYQAALSGGTDASRYYLSSTYDNDVGIVDWNWDKKFAARLNTDVQANSKLRLQGDFAHIRDRIRLMQPGINPDPFSNLVWGSVNNLSNPDLRGFGFAPPELWSTVESHADVDRTTANVTMQFEPLRWFTHKLTAGVDASSENNWTLYPLQTPQNQTYYGSQGLGQKSVDRTTVTIITLDYAGNLKYNWRKFDFTTSVGLQHFRTTTSGINATGNTFAASPITTVSGGASRSGTENYGSNATVGMFVQQQMGWDNRWFLTLALRGDDNSSFGKDFSAAYYPKVSGSWVISEEDWFKVPQVNNLRLRAAYGAAGTQPGTFDAQRLYNPATGYNDAAGLVPGSYGNPELSPERSAELEFGAEATVLDERVDLSYTHFGRKVTDAIVNVPLPPSSGFTGSQVVNIGKVSAWGNEYSANVKVLRGDRVGLEIGGQFANNGNRIDDLGGADFLAVGGGGQAQNRVGWGIADFFMYKVRNVTLDPNGNVTSATCDGGTGKDGLEQGGPDVPCASAPRVYWGHSQPTWQAGLNMTLTLYHNWRIYAGADGNGGHLQSDTEIRALHNQGSTAAVILRNDPLLQEYRAIEADVPGTYNAGFFRLRELSATYSFTNSLLHKIGASGGSISIAGRNLSMLWTAMQGWNTSRDGEVYVDIADQHVWDPETRAVGSRSNGYQSILPATASFVSTLRLTF